MAAKNGGGNPDANPRLRTILAKAKENNMPADNIDRAIKKGTGELPGVVYEEINYEGYAVGGVAILVDVLTENKNRAASEIRSVFDKKGGNMSGAGSVAWVRGPGRMLQAPPPPITTSVRAGPAGTRSGAPRRAGARPAAARL